MSFSKESYKIEQARKNDLTSKLKETEQEYEEDGTHSVLLQRALKAIYESSKPTEKTFVGKIGLENVSIRVYARERDEIEITKPSSTVAKRMGNVAMAIEISPLKFTKEHDKRLRRLFHEKTLSYEALGKTRRIDIERTGLGYLFSDTIVEGKRESWRGRIDLMFLSLKEQHSIEDPGSITLYLSEQLYEEGLLASGMMNAIDAVLKDGLGLSYH